MPKRSRKRANKSRQGTPVTPTFDTGHSQEEPLLSSDVSSMPAAEPSAAGNSPHDATQQQDVEMGGVEEEANTETSQAQQQAVELKKKPPPNSDSTSDSTKPTTPPRVSFGVEIEFVLLTKRPGQSDPDADRAHSLPPLTGAYEEPLEAVAACLMRHEADGLRAYVASEEQTLPRDPCAWHVKRDLSIEYPEGTGYDWHGVELVSPASYAVSEAFAVIKLVVRLITSNLRVAVSSTCGLHVHVGNGPHRMDMRALRRYAALLWSAEPLLSTLHCPSRLLGKHSGSIRRVRGTPLTDGEGAREAHAYCLGGVRWAARYQGRARKIGEAPVASREELARRMAQVEVDEEGRLLEPECPSDDSDWEDESTEPFFRRRKDGTKRRVQNGRLACDEEALPSLEEVKRIDNRGVSQGPPQISFPLPRGVRSNTRPDDHQLPSYGEQLLLNILPVHHQTPYSDNLEDALTIRHRCPQKRIPVNRRDALSTDPRPFFQPLRSDTWSAVQEILACDVGAHQLEWLFSRGLDGKPLGANWAGQSKSCLEVLPGSGATFPKNRWMTVESRAAGGSLDGDWIAAWARISCRLLEWARDADPSDFVGVVGRLAEEEYSVAGLLVKLGLYRETVLCEERLQRGERAWYECMLLKGETCEEEGDEDEDESTEG